MTKLVNLTPHAITVCGREFPASGQVARVAETVIRTGELVVDGVIIPLIRKSFGEVVGLPDAVDDTVYVVSMMVRSALHDRLDVVTIGESIRDSQGKIVGASSLAVI